MINRGSVVIMSSTTDTHNMYSTEIQGNSYFGVLGDSSHTVQVSYVDFIGRLRFQATLVVEPEANDWFDIIPEVVTPGHSLANEGYVEYTTGNEGQGTKAYTIKGNYAWIRLYMDREHIIELPRLNTEQYPNGQILTALFLT